MSNVLLLPGYSEGHHSVLLKSILSYFSQKNHVVHCYLKDENKEDSRDYFFSKAYKAISAYEADYIIGKSWGGVLGLCIADYYDQPVKGIIILGFPFLLGYPPQISLLKDRNPTLPDYKKEFRSVLNNLEKKQIPIYILQGDKDDLGPIYNLIKIADKFRNINVIPFAGSSHSFEVEEKKQFFSIINEIEQIISNDD